MTIVIAMMNTIININIIVTFLPIIIIYNCTISAGLICSWKGQKLDAIHI